MRTATPLATCSRMTDRDPSATSDAISTPRFIGPGCMTMASGAARRSRAGVTPKRWKYSRSDGKKWPRMRSSCTRSSMITSAPSTASSTDVVARTPSLAMSGSIRVAGPHAQTSAPRARSSSRFERNTRLCSRSPMMETLSPANPPLCSRIVKASRRACVGCSCMPSPALMTRAPHRRATRCPAPADACRRTSMSGAIASRLRTVSASVSPFETLEPAEAMFTVSALSRFSAISNEVRVRVLGSQKRLTTVWPRRAGTFLIDRVPTSFMASAVSSTSRISSGDRSATLSRSLVRRRAGTSSGNGGSAARRDGSAVGVIVR